MLAIETAVALPGFTATTFHLRQLHKENSNYAKAYDLSGLVTEIIMFSYYSNRISNVP